MNRKHCDEHLFLEAYRDFKPSPKGYAYNSYPQWLEDEKKARQNEPDYRYFVSGVSITFLTPAGNEEVYKFYPFEKKKLAFEDFARAIRFLEDRYMIFLEKTGFVDSMVEKINNNIELSKIRQRVVKKYAYPKQEGQVLDKDSKTGSTRR